MKNNKKKNKFKITEDKKSFLEDKFGLPEELASFIRTLFIVGVSFLVVYLIVILLGKKGVFEAGYTKLPVSESTISYETILASNTFDMKDNEYYVLFSNFNSTGYNLYLYNLLNMYEKDTKIYKVNTKDGMNKSVLSDTSNKKATKATELKINTDTLIKIKNKKIVSYFEGEDAIAEELLK